MRRARALAGRLAATLRCDLRLQWRNGFYAASAFVVIGSLALLRWLPERALELLLPVVILSNVLTNSFYFVAGLLLLEQGEGTRAAQAVSPLRTGEYLLSKLGTLGLLSLVESLVLVLLVRGPAPGLPALALGLLLASVVLTLFGVVCVARYRSINEFLMPSVLYTIVLALPTLAWFGLGAWWLHVWLPLGGAVVLMGAGAEPLAPAALGAALLSSSFWVAVAFRLGRRALRASVLA